MKLIENKLRIFEGFAGIGAVSKAIETLNIPHELVGFSEIDKYAIKSFCAVHNVDGSLNWGDICNIDETKLPDMDLFTFGSPCQDFSVAGKQKGAAWKCDECGHEYNPLDVHYNKRDYCPNCNSSDINKTRSSLVVEALRIIRYKKPKYLLMENVKNLVGKFKTSFDTIISELNEYGYNTYWKVLNAKDYGIPQNRERVFVISIRKDIDIDSYKFPERFDNGIRLKDILEKEVDEKYYISQEKTERLIAQLKDKNSLMLDMCQAKREGHPREYTDYSPTLSARDYKEPRLINELIQVGVLKDGGHEQSNRVYSENGVSPTIMAGNRQTCMGGYVSPKVLQKQSISENANELIQVGELDIKGMDCIKRVYSTEGICPTLTDMQGGNRQPKILEENSNGLQFVGGIGNKDWAGDGKEYSRNFPQGNRVYDSKGIACSQTAQGGGIGSYTGLYLETYKIRKLIPKECWRLMGFKDEDFENAKNAGISDTQLYKQAGNSIVVDVLIHIFNNLFLHNSNQTFL